MEKNLENIRNKVAALTVTWGPDFVKGLPYMTKIQCKWNVDTKLKEKKRTQKILSTGIFIQFQIHFSWNRYSGTRKVTDLQQLSSSIQILKIFPGSEFPGPL